MEMETEIQVDDLSGPSIAELLTEHLNDMHATSPPESVHALDLTALKAPNITFWSVYSADVLVGCGALKELAVDHGEIKSMRVKATYRGRGIAKILLNYLISEARSRGYRKISLETGSMAFFEPARNLYQDAGFTHCAPFADYIEDPNSVFMEMVL